MAEAQNTTILDLDSLLDSTMDNVPDVPDFLTPPDGLYKLACSDAKIEEYEVKKGENKGAKRARIKITHKVVATIETNGVPVPDNSLFSEQFMATEEGLKYFKKAATKMLNVSDLNGVPIREVLASLKDAEYDARVTTKKSKGDDGSEFENVNVRPIPPAAE